MSNPVEVRLDPHPPPGPTWSCPTRSRSGAQDIPPSVPEVPRTDPPIGSERRRCQLRRRTLRGFMSGKTSGGVSPGSRTPTVSGNSWSSPGPQGKEDAGVRWSRDPS